jgi:hypothetical protein
MVARPLWENNSRIVYSWCLWCGPCSTLSFPAEAHQKNDSGYWLRIFDGASFVGCVPDGPFAPWIVRLGPDKFVAYHCLVRGTDDGFLSSRSVVRGMKFASYYDYRLDFDGKPIITSIAQDAWWRSCCGSSRRRWVIFIRARWLAGLLFRLPKKIISSC